MSDWYMLDKDHNVVGPVKLLVGAKFLSDPNRIVAKTKVYDGCEVSTVFIGLDHRFGPGKPLVFETLVFGGPFDQDGDRYSTWVEAEAGHARFVEKCQPIMTEDAK